MRRIIAFAVQLLCGLELASLSVVAQSANIQGAHPNSLDLAITRLNRPGTKLEDAISLLGEPEKYAWGRRTFTKDKLPDTFILHYTNGFDILVSGGLVDELRCHEGCPPFTWAGKLRLGSLVEEVLLVCGPPSRTISGQPVNYGEGVLYKDIDGKRGSCYYAPAGHPARFFFEDYKVVALYISVAAPDHAPGPPAVEDRTAYPTLLSPTGTLAIVRRPPPADFHRARLRMLPSYDPERAGVPAQVDLRSYDVSSLDLTGRLADLLHANFDSKTRWPAKFPDGFDPDQIMRLARDPGLRVRELHTQGITGKGVGIGIIDQALLVDHVEYRDRLRLYEEIHWPEGEAQMHGPAVASIAVGKTVGVAPEADLYYIAESHGIFRGEGKFDWDFTYVAKSIDRLLEVNDTLPANKKIRVISISLGWSPDQAGYKEVMAAAERAAKANVFVISTSLERTAELAFHGLGRDPLADPNTFDSYRPGEFWAAHFWAGRGRFLPGERLLAPMDARCIASPTGPDDYVYYSEGGWSWSVPWIAGLYALACQVKPDITPSEFWAEALRTGKTIPLRRKSAEIDFGSIADPVNLIRSLKR